MNPRLSEIWNDIDAHLQAILALRMEEKTIVSTSAEYKSNEVPLYFDDTVRTIRWDCGILKLSKKQFSLIKILWNGKGRTETLDEIESVLWHTVGTEEKPFIGKNTLFVLISRLRNNVSGFDFPYEIESVKNFSTGELQGYRLVLKK
jgi:DNA-binding response OmpR family regulator